MRERPDPMDLACELVKSSHADRDLAQYKLALELCDALASYEPARFPPRPYLLEDKTFAEVEASLPNASFALALGNWRALVTDLEAVSAQRLIVLCSTVRTLCKLGDRTTDQATLDRIDGMLNRLATHLGLAWRIDPPADAIDLRTWTVQVTRRYDLLPRAWRYV